MNAALKRPWTTEQFLAWEERQGLRHGFDGFRGIARAGGTAAHAAIQRNLIVALWAGLRGKPCQPYGSELKIRVADQVLSEISATDDLVTKNAEYCATPSVERYVILQQAAAAAVVFSRKGDDWVTDLPTTENAILRMPEIDLDIPLSEIYLGIEFETGEAPAAG